MIRKNKQKGFVALIGVLIVSAIGLTVSVSLISLGLSSSQTSFVNFRGSQAVVLANSCAESALQEIRDSNSYIGTNTYNLGSGSCTFTVTSNGAQNRTIQSEGRVDSLRSRIIVTIDAINPDINITGWQEVADF